MMAKKAEGLPLHIVIVAIMLVLVLIVVILFFQGKIGGFGRDVENCFNRGGYCKETACADYEREMPTAACPAIDDKAWRCCISLVKSCREQGGIPAAANKCLGTPVSGSYPDVSSGQICCVGSVSP